MSSVTETSKAVLPTGLFIRKRQTGFELLMSGAESVVRSSRVGKEGDDGSVVMMLLL